MQRGWACSVVMALGAMTRDARAGEPLHPLRFDEQAHETRIDAAYTRSTRNDARDDATGGFQIALMFGAFPQLKWWRIGGASGFMFRAVDDKTFLVSLPYADLKGGVRLGPVEAYSFVGMSWLTLGISHAEFAFGALAPRAGVGLGVETRSLSVDAFAATEYHPFFVGTSDVRAYVLGLSFAFIGRPER